MGNDHFDAMVGAMGFVVRRDPNRDWEIANLVNNRYHILAYAAGGRAYYRCDGEDFTVSKGSLLFFPKGHAHSAKSDPNMPWSFFSAAFDLQYFDPQVAAAMESLPHHVVVRNAGELSGLFSELERLWVVRELGFLLRCRSIILQLLHIFLRTCCSDASTVSHARRLAPIVAMLQGNPSKTFPIEDLAEMADLSPSRFRVLFREYTGHSVVQYQNWLRVNRAKDLLLSGEHSVTQAAKEVGFVDVFYFSRLFKKLTGYNPSYFRN
ncbi:MAG: AraC family transcriptional regulator, partial [Thermoguttaceae bacterium]